MCGYNRATHTYTHTCTKLYFHAGNLSVVPPTHGQLLLLAFLLLLLLLLSLSFHYLFKKDGRGRAKRYVFLWRNTYLRASIFPTCTWNIRDRLSLDSAISLLEDAQREEGNEFYASFLRPLPRILGHGLPEISIRFRRDIRSFISSQLFKTLDDRANSIDTSKRFF